MCIRDRGEFGHMTINPAETETCACGRRGCVQQYVSASGIARLARKYLAEHEGASVLRSVKKLTTKDVFDAAKNGDGAATVSYTHLLDCSLLGDPIRGSPKRRPQRRL